MERLVPAQECQGNVTATVLISYYSLTSVSSGPPKIVSGVDSNYGSYALQGCYDASSQGYVITGATTSSSMTLEYCASYCKGTPYFAIENGRTLCLAYMLWYQS